MSIQSIKPLSTNLTARAADAKPPQEAKPFVRNAAASSAGNVAFAAAKDKGGALENWKSQVLAACQNLRINRGAHKELVVNGERMVLRRTGSNDAYVFQTREDSINAPFNGLRIADNGEMQYNMAVLGYNTESAPGFAQFSKLGVALGVPHGGFGYDDNGSSRNVGV